MVLSSEEGAAGERREDSWPETLPRGSSTGVPCACTCELCTGVDIAGLAVGVTTGDGGGFLSIEYEPGAVGGCTHTHTHSFVEEHATEQNQTITQPNNVQSSHC